jgi:hypothetical protein
VSQYSAEHTTPAVSSHTQQTANDKSRAIGKRHFNQQASITSTSGNHTGIATVKITAPRTSPGMLMRRRFIRQA